MPKILSPYKRHKLKWKECEACLLCERRSSVVLARGKWNSAKESYDKLKFPCDVLFIGEAPGPAEDDFGIPFAGPAGILLDEIVEEALYGYELSCIFSNLVACIPLDEEGTKWTEPPLEAIRACAGRLVELCSMSNPKLVVAVGALAKKHIPKNHASLKDAEFLDIVHPAAILRANVAARSMMRQTAMVKLHEAVEEVF